MSSVRRIKKEDSFWDNFEYESRGVFADFGSEGNVQERYEMFKKLMKVSVRKSFHSIFFDPLILGPQSLSFLIFLITIPQFLHANCFNFFNDTISLSDFFITFSLVLGGFLPN